MKSLRFTSLSLDPQSLRSGRAFGEVLHGMCVEFFSLHLAYNASIQMFRLCISIVNYFSDDEFFNEIWIEKIAQYDSDSNWRVKANNLRKVW